MRIDDDESRFLWWPAISTIDPTDASNPVLEITDPAGVVTPHAMTWAGAATTTAGVWRRSARTVSRFVGTSRTAGVGEVALAAGRHMGQPRATFPDGQVIAGPVTPIDVA